MNSFYAPVEEMLCRDIMDIVHHYQGQEMTPAVREALDKDLHSLKSLETYSAMKGYGEDEGGSYGDGGNSYGGPRRYANGRYAPTRGGNSRGDGRGSYDGGSYDGMPNDGGNSGYYPMGGYRDGGMGKYPYMGGRSYDEGRGRYSRHDGMNEIKTQLQDAMNNASDDKTREAIKKALKMMED